MRLASPPRLAAALALAGAAAIAAAAPVDIDTAKKEATAAAQSWLALVDAGKFDDSWKASSATFRQHVGQPSWGDAARKAREPLGKFGSRSLHSATYTDGPPGPGAPPGVYVIAVFDAVYDKGKVSEQVAMQHESDGTWRAAGYFIRPAEGATASSPTGGGTAGGGADGGTPRDAGR